MFRPVVFYGVLVYGLLVSGVALAGESCAQLATLERVESLVKVQPAGAAFPLRRLELPHALCAGDELFTLGGGRALVRHAGGELVVAQNSRLRIRAGGEVEALAGQLLFDIEKRQQLAPVSVHTPLIVIGVKGTRFLVAVADQLSEVALASGLVEVQRQDGQEVALYESKPLAQMSMDEYRQQVQAQFAEYSSAQLDGFAAYKKRLHTEFAAYTQQVQLQPGNQLVFGQEDGMPMALHGQISKDNAQLQAELAQWLD